MNEQIHIFDRALVRQHRDRAAARYARHRVLCEESATYLMERIGDVKRDIKTILDLGAHDGLLARQLAWDSHFVVATDLSNSMLADYPHAVVADEEILPFQSESFDLVVSNLALHWVNDLPGTLAQIRNCLKPEGLFLASLLGGQTLIELRTCLLEAELAVTGGVSPRLSPNIDRQTASALLQRAGFSLPVTDGEMLTLTYTDIYALMRDLRGMGESNALRQRRRQPTQRAIFDRANQLYKERFGLSEGKIPATFELIFLHGWK